MKKFFVLFVVLCVSAPAYAWRVNTTPFKLSVLGSGAPTDALPEAMTVMGLDVGILGTTTEYVFGLQIASVNARANYLYGVQVSAVGVEGDVAGISLSLANQGSARGLALSAIGTSDVTGIDVAVIKAAKSLNKGLLINAISYNDEVQGAQIGIINVNQGRMIGLQIGLFNYTRELHGVQIGLINMAFNAPIYTLPLINFNF